MRGNTVHTDQTYTSAAVAWQRCCVALWVVPPLTVYIYTSRHLENENVRIKRYDRARAAVWFTLRRKCRYFHW